MISLPTFRGVLSGFNPLSLSPALWLNDTGSDPSTWTDMSGNGRNATSATPPSIVTNALNGKQVRRFDGVNDFLSCGDTLDVGTEAITIICVASVGNGLTGVTGIVGKSKLGSQLGRYSLFREDSVLSGLSQFNEVSVAQKTSDTSLSIRILSTTLPRSNGTSISNTLHINGSLAATSSSYTGTITNYNSTDLLLIGAYQNSSGNAPLAGTYLNGDMAEIFIFNSALSSTNRLRVERYLSGKYAIAF